MNSTHTPRTPTRLLVRSGGLIAGLLTAGVLVAGCGAGGPLLAPPGTDRASATRADSPAEPGNQSQPAMPAPGTPRPAAAPIPASGPGSGHTTPSSATAGPGTPRPDPAVTAAGPTEADLAGIDRALADLTTALIDADHDVATPEGDLP